MPPCFIPPCTSFLTKNPLKRGKHSAKSVQVCFYGELYHGFFFLASVFSQYIPRIFAFLRALFSLLLFDGYYIIIPHKDSWMCYRSMETALQGYTFLAKTARAKARLGLGGKPPSKNQFEIGLVKSYAAFIAPCVISLYIHQA